MRKTIFLLTLGLVLLASCGEQHKAQSLVKDFLQENVKDGDCSFERFGKLTPTAMIDFDKARQMRREMSRLPYINSTIDYHDGTFPDTLRYIQTTYKLKGSDGKEQEITQTFYMDKGLTRVVAFKQN